MMLNVANNRSCPVSAKAGLCDVSPLRHSLSALCPKPLTRHYTTMTLTCAKLLWTVKNAVLACWPSWFQLRGPGLVNQLGRAASEEPAFNPLSVWISTSMHFQQVEGQTANKLLVSGTTEARILKGHAIIYGDPRHANYIYIYKSPGPCQVPDRLNQHRVRWFRTKLQAISGKK